MRIIKCATRSDKGRVRENNEDAVLVRGPLLAVADGMGGHGSGEVASALAIEALGSAALDKDTPEHELGTALEDSFIKANRAVHDKWFGGGSPFGTTLVAGCLTGNRLIIANVGDSRAYLFRAGALRQLTEDHTVSMLRLQRGVITREQLEDDPFRNKLYRAIGTEDYVEVDIAEVALADGDIVLLCSDGLHGVLSEEQIGKLLAGADPERSATALVAAANAAGGPDNVSVVIALVSGDVPVERIETRTRLLRRVHLFRELDDAELALLARYLEEFRCQSGSTLTRQGEPGDDFVVLIEGRVHVTADGTSLRDLGPGAHFGELALVAPAPRSTTITALETCYGFKLSREGFLDLCHRRPYVGQKISSAVLAAMAAMIRDLTDRISGAERALRGRA
jgi:serine/threonine protein phosphatase PrpC